MHKVLEVRLYSLSKPVLHNVEFSLCLAMAEFQTRVRTLERTSKALKSDKVLLQEDLSSLREQLATKEKELREVKSSVREGQDELARLTDKSVNGLCIYNLCPGICPSWWNSLVK